MPEHSPRPRPPKKARTKLRQTAEKAFGLSRLRPEQLAAMEQLLEGRDVLVVMPTGSGKSAIYQVPALELPGPTVVVSPLIALQRDQVNSLEESAAPEAVAVNSAQGAQDSTQAWKAIGNGNAEYIFLAPEQLAKEDVLGELQRARPTLFVVDEAHCVSAWGHDFRPDYLRLRHAIGRLGHPRVLALTATAGGPIREDIVGHLGMSDPVRIVAGFDRPNLYLQVRHAGEAVDKLTYVADWVESAPKPGLVYAATRRDTERCAEALTDRGVRAAAFHAGLKQGERKDIQEEFMADHLEVVVATSAFGMGIDKPNVRFVAHASVPESLDSYYQQIGRAGRDDQRADAVLFYRPEDLGLQRFLTARPLDPADVKEVAEAVQDHNGPVSPTEVDREVDQSRRKAMNSLNLLEQADVVRTTDRGRFDYDDEDIAPEDAAEQAAEVSAKRKQLDRSRIDVLRNYAETASCRRQFLLGYFGESLERPCGFCDTCDAGTAQAHAAPADTEFPADSRVRHPEWGQGTVVNQEADRITVLFDDEGYRTLSLAAVHENDLLAAD
ncbi:RecQ family ATP-dependent DNA helicase [Amycolatopsis palatopharyngis]|uniref:RecQ family ATP-dependent DNA helicase n=1 Tax=Amycolatopsis palatopharyngis TaxID=187982 RepID=UPI000E25FFCC|nr:ATP-dependent DNA helicase RecQ [Amycolatopsis palatopharyngis]